MNGGEITGAGREVSVDSAADGQWEAPPGEWLALLAELIRRYTMEESSSVPRELAEELVQSARFCVALHRRMRPGEDRLPLAERFQAGRRLVWELARETEPLLTLCREATPPYANRSLRDTLVGLGEFFRLYDWQFFAHEIPGSIDYPLEQPVEESLQGVLYIRAYLGRLLAELRFLGCFAPEQGLAACTAYYHDPGDLMVNLFRPVFGNALALCLCGRDPLSLNPAREDREGLFLSLRPFRRDAAQEAVLRGWDVLCRRLEIGDAESRAYLRRCALDLLPLLEATGEDGWGRLFPSLRG